MKMIWFSSIRRSRLALIMTLLFAFLMLPVVYAYISYIPEDSGNFYEGATALNSIYGTGRGNHADRYCPKSTTNCPNSAWGMWDLPDNEPTGTYRYKVWIPQQGTPYDATVRYYIVGYGSSHTKTVNQESYADEWVDLGTRYSRGANLDGRVTLANTNCVTGCVYGEIWWDDLEYSR